MNKIVVIVSLIFISNTALADDMNVALGDMCQKLKACSLEQVSASQALSPEMKKQMELMFDKSCASIEQNYLNGIKSFPQHYKLALACVKSMANASCEVLMDSDEKSKECKDYEKFTSQ